MTRSFDLSFVYEKAGEHPSQDEPLMQWFANSLSAETRIHFMDEAYQRFKEWPDRKSIPREKLPELHYACLLKVLKYSKMKVDNAHQKKNTFNKLEAPEKSFLSEVDLAKLKKIKKEGKNAKYVRSKIKAIEELRSLDPPASWRQISDFFKKKYRKDISYTYIRDVYKRITS